MGKSWKRLLECGLCGNSRCVQSTENPRLAYCHRFGKSYFLSNDRQSHNVAGDEKGSQKAKSKENKDQDLFDFDNDNNWHLKALE